MAELSKKSLEMNKTLDMIGEILFKKSRMVIQSKVFESITEDKCICCDGKASAFRDELSRKEFSISGLCQKCQDAVFGEE